MLRRLWLLLMIIFLIGCSSGEKTNEPLSEKTPINEDDNSSGIIKSETETTTVSIGDYSINIPSVWANSDKYYYLNQEGEPPFVMIDLMNDVELSGILEHKDEYISGSLGGLENGELISDFSEVKFENASGYAYSIKGILSGYDAIFTTTLFENPSGGTVSISLMDTGTDALSQYQEMLNTIYINSSVTASEDRPSSASGAAIEGLAFQDSILYNDRGIVISTDSIDRDNSSTAFSFVVQNSTDSDYNIEAHSWDINGLMSWKGKNDYNLVKVPAGKKARMTIKIDNTVLETFRIDTISEIDVLFWIFDESSIQEGWETGLINAKTNQYDSSLRITLKGEPDYSDEVIDVWYVELKSSGKYGFYVYNKSQYNAVCTVENCSVNDWAYNITDYTSDLFEEPVNSGSYVAMILPIDESFMGENNITNVESIEFDISMKDESWIFKDGHSDRWEYQSDKMTFTQF